MGRVKVHAFHDKGFAISDAHVFGNHSAPPFNCTFMASLWAERAISQSRRGTTNRPTNKTATIFHDIHHLSTTFAPPTIPSLRHACPNPVHGPFGQVRPARQASYFDDETIKRAGDTSAPLAGQIARVIASATTSTSHVESALFGAKAIATMWKSSTLARNGERLERQVQPASPVVS